MKKFFSLSALAFMALMPLCLVAQYDAAKQRTGTFYFLKDFDHPLYDYPKGYESGDVSTDKIVANEILRVCLVQRAIDGVTRDSNAGIQVDAAGQLVLNGATNAVWLPIICEEGEEDYLKLDANGIPTGCKEGTRWDVGCVSFEVDATDFSFDSVQGVATGDYLYLVLLDTRTGLGECEGEPVHVARYATALCIGAEVEIEKEIKAVDLQFNLIATPRDFVVWDDANDEYEWSRYHNDIHWPGIESGWQPAAEITALTVTQKDPETQEEEEVTYTDNDLAKYLTPTIEGFSQANDKIALNLTGGASDVMYYTLYTKEKLSEKWRPFAEVYAEKCENAVDKSIGKQYTRFRIDGNSPLEIPLIDGDTSRFYLLGGDNLGK